MVCDFSLKPAPEASNLETAVTVSPDGTKVSDSSVVVRPAPANRLPGTGVIDLLRNPFTILGGSLLLVYGLRQAFAGDAPWAWLLVLTSVGVVALGVHYRLYLRNVSLYVQGEKFGYTNFLGARREFAAKEVSQLRLCSVVFNGGSSIQPYLLALSVDKSCLFTIATADLLSVRDLWRVAGAAGISVAGSWNDQVPLSDLNKRYPGALSALSRLIVGDVKHPQLFSRLIGAALVVLILLVVVYVIARSQGRL